MSDFVSVDEIRNMFSRIMSDMYRKEVPQYGTLLDLVAEVNDEVLAANASLKRSLEKNDELARLGVERHGAIRLGTAKELSTISRLFAVMGMHPVGYYDLAAAGVPVHATAFRPVDDASLRRNPFRVFTSLLRLELIDDVELRRQAADILSRRKIFTQRAIELIEQWEKEGGLKIEHALEFAREASETFRWHKEASVDVQSYRKLHDAHRLIADVVSFKGPHINHLTPRTLDIDEVQRRMPLRGISAKAVIEGPPRRRCDILLRQTSFKALDEPIAFIGSNGGDGASTHTARFGEIEQRGAALTRKGRQLYDTLLAEALASKKDYVSALDAAFTNFPDDWESLRSQGLAYFKYHATDAGRSRAADLSRGGSADIEYLIRQGLIAVSPILYEDFLPISAAGIFQSNLGDQAPQAYEAEANRESFEQMLGEAVRNEVELYAKAEAASRRQALLAIGFE